MLYTRNRARKPRLNWGRIAFAALALAIVGASGYFLAAGLMGGPGGLPGEEQSPTPQTAEQGPTPPAATPSITPSASPSPSPEDSQEPVGSGLLHFGAVGEIAGGSGLLQGARAESSYDFSEVFAKIHPYTAQFDFLLGALGTTISKGGEYSERKTPEPLLGALKAIGFDVLTLDNGHGYDYGLDGARETRGLVQAAGLVGIGFGTESAEDDSPCILEGEGLRVAVLSYSLEAVEASAESQGHVRLLSEAALSADMLAVKEAGADFVVACVYWGDGGASELTQAQKDWAKKLADAGVGAVIGSQPQYLQKLSTITAADGRKT
ncbi:MAG: CapA family protein, partial [Christensenellaceae bacterium]|nr:CapA family protein [Christensenellaceae bacterium]